MGFELMCRRGPSWSVVVVVIATLLCAHGRAADKGAHAGHKSSAKTALGVTSLDVYAESGRLHLLIAERSESGRSPEIRYLRSEDGGNTWSTPAAVGIGQPGPEPAHRGLDAQIAAAGDRLVAIWTTGAETRFGRGPLATAVSEDGGQTWHAGPNPSDDGLATDHAFAEVAADDAGTFHAVWLDGRPSATTAGNTGKGLRYARSTDGGRSWSANATLDAQCCECCWNSILTLPGRRVHVLYRDRDPRDMALLSSADGGLMWGQAIPIGEFNWEFNGCPHVGGALAATGADGKSMSAVVWTAKGGSDVGVFALSSADGGRSWSPRARLGGPQSSRPDIAAGGGSVVATWDEYISDAEGGDNVAFATMSKDDGKTWSAPIRLSAPGASATYPRVVRLPDGFRVFWTQKEPGKPVSWESRPID